MRGLGPGRCSGRCCSLRRCCWRTSGIRHSSRSCTGIPRPPPQSPRSRALQAIYSPDFEKALQQMVFFYVPFALLFCLLRRLRWSPALLRRCLILIVGLALLLAAVGLVEYGTKTLFLIPKLIAENNVHTYFAINSVFFDADIFGRFLALVMVLLAAVLACRRGPRAHVKAGRGVAAALAGLVLTLSRSRPGGPRRGGRGLGARRSG